MRFIQSEAEESEHARVCGYSFVLRVCAQRMDTLVYDTAGEILSHCDISAALALMATSTAWCAWVRAHVLRPRGLTWSVGEEHMRWRGKYTHGRLSFFGYSVGLRPETSGQVFRYHSNPQYCDAHGRAYMFHEFPFDTLVSRLREKGVWHGVNYGDRQPPSPFYKSTWPEADPWIRWRSERFDESKYMGRVYHWFQAAVFVDEPDSVIDELLTMRCIVAMSCHFPTRSGFV